MITVDGLRKWAEDNNIDLVVVSPKLIRMEDKDNNRSVKLHKFMKDIGGIGKRPLKDPNDFRDVVIDEFTIKFKNKTNKMDSTVTSVYEASYCYMLSKFYYGKIEKVNTPGVDVEDVEDILSNSKSWNTAVIKSCNLLNSKLPKNKNYSFERQSQNVKFIEKVFKSINKSSKYFVNINKWNPSDIWIFDLDVISDFKSELSEVKSYEELNEVIKTHLQNGSVYGISLKKAEYPKLIDVNLIRRAEDIQYTLTEMTPKSKSGSAISTASNFIHYVDMITKTNSYFEMRSDGSSIDNWNIEIHTPGSKAAHGKLGKGTVEKIYNKISPNHFTFTKLGKEETIDKIVEYLKILGYDIKREEIEGNMDRWLYPKYYGLHLINALNNESDEIKLKIVNELVKSAKSQSSFSSPHLKIESHIKRLKAKALLRESTSKVVTYGIISMAAKPFHTGHMRIIEYASKQCDEVIVLVSDKNRSRPNEITIYGKDMINIWNDIISKYLPANVKWTKSGSPISDAYKIIESANENNSKDKFIIFTGEDDIKNYSRVDKYDKVDIKIKSFLRDDASITGNISGTKMRHFLESGKKDEFMKNLPPEFSDEDKNKYYNILYFSLNMERENEE